MSVQASSWAFAQKDLPSGTKFLLVAIANHADKAGVCYPGRQTLADDCCCRRETVTANMGRLEEQGLLSRFERRRASGSRTSDWVVLAPLADDRGAMIDADPAEVPSFVAAVARKTSGEDSQPEDFSGEVDPASQVRKTGRPYEPSEEPSVEADASTDMAEDFELWLEHHQRVTGLQPPRHGTAAWREASSMHRARRDEGYSSEDLKTATVGAFNDPFRRENGHFGCVSVLRPKKVHDLVEKGRVFLRRGHQRGAGQLSNRDTCKRCPTQIADREANNQSGLCDDCYARFVDKAGAA